jgi:hypothetical protein
MLARARRTTEGFIMIEERLTMQGDEGWKDVWVMATKGT